MLGLWLEEFLEASQVLWLANGRDLLLEEVGFSLGYQIERLFDWTGRPMGAGQVGLLEEDFVDFVDGGGERLLYCQARTPPAWDGLGMVEVFVDEAFT